MQIEQIKLMLSYTAQGMIKSEPELTLLDQAIGDGDHGIGIARGFNAVFELLQSADFQPIDIGDCLSQVGTRLMTSMGGASGAIFGTLFRAGGKSLVGVEQLTALQFSHFLNDGWQAVFYRGQAKQGDKTMVDALAAAAIEAKKCEKLPLSQSLNQCASVAMSAAEETKSMVARFGRAKNLAERSIGHCDPGAVSMALILKYMNEYVQSCSV